MSSTIIKLILRNGRFGHRATKATTTYQTSAYIPARFKCDKPHKSDLGSSTILMQDGLHVQELPVIVRRVKDVLAPFENKIDCNSGFTTKYTSGENDIHDLINKEFIRCRNLDDIVALLSKCSTITPNIALGAIERIYELRDLQSNYNIAESSCSVNILPSHEMMENLVEIIKTNDDIYALLRALRVVMLRDDNHLSNICDEVLERVTDNKLSISQLCDVVSFFYANKHIERFSDSIDKCWVGFVGREKEFNDESMLKCFEILHCLKTSQKIVFGALEKRMITLWWQLKSDAMISVMESICRNRIASSKIFPILGRWLNTNIHSVSEDALLQIVAKFTQIGHTDSQIQKALERYIKARGLKITSHILIVTIMNHCQAFRIRNTEILNGCAEYFITNASKLEPLFIKPIFYPFGYLNFQPDNGLKFWQTIEDVFNEKFQRINTEDVLDIMLACIYLQKHPLNFVPKVFNPYFLDQINSAPRSQILRNKLKLIDTALMLESKNYKGPLLPKDHSCKSIWTDGRVRRLVNNVRDTFEKIVGSYDCLSTSVILPRVFTTELYIVDIMYHPKNLRSSILNLGLKSDKNVNIAILINLPEHLCSNGEALIGPQMMRIKHMRLLGLKVANLKYDTLSRLKVHRIELEKYINERLKHAQDAF